MGFRTFTHDTQGSSNIMNEATRQTPATTPGKVPTAYIDANVLKFSATALLRLFPRTQLIDWGNGLTSEHKYYELRYVNPNDKIPNATLRHEVELLEAVAQLIKTGRITAVADIETHFESWGLPDMDGWTGRFYGAPVG